MDFNYQIVPIIISLFGIILLILFRKKVNKESYLFSLWVSGIVFFSVYILLILSVAILDAYYWAEYYSFDLNENGSIEKHEQTEAYHEALKKVTNDTARNFVFITGLFISMIVSTTVLIIGIIARFIRLKKE